MKPMRGKGWMVRGDHETKWDWLGVTLLLLVNGGWIILLYIYSLFEQLS